MSQFKLNQPSALFVPVFTSTKPVINTLTLNSGSDGNVALDKKGLYYIYTNNANASLMSTFDFSVGQSAATFSQFRMAAMPSEIIQFFFQTIDDGAVLHGYQASGSNTAAYISFMGV